MLTGIQYRERALAALGRGAECSDHAALAEWLQLSQSWLALGAIADAQDSCDQLFSAEFQIGAIARSGARRP